MNRKLYTLEQCTINGDASNRMSTGPSEAKLNPVRLITTFHWIIELIGNLNQLFCKSLLHNFIAKMLHWCVFISNWWSAETISNWSNWQISHWNRSWTDWLESISHSDERHDFLLNIFINQIGRIGWMNLYVSSQMKWKSWNVIIKGRKIERKNDKWQRFVGDI